MTHGMSRPITRRRLLAAATAVPAATTSYAPGHGGLGELAGATVAAGGGAGGQPALALGGGDRSLRSVRACSAPTRSAWTRSAVSMESPASISFKRASPRTAPPRCCCRVRHCWPGWSAIAGFGSMPDRGLRCGAAARRRYVATRAPIGPGATTAHVGRQRRGSRAAGVARATDDGCRRRSRWPKMAGDPLAQRDVDAVYVGSTVSRELLARQGWTPRFALACAGRRLSARGSAFGIDAVRARTSRGPGAGCRVPCRFRRRVARSWRWLCPPLRRRPCWPGGVAGASSWTTPRRSARSPLDARA